MKRLVLIALLFVGCTPAAQPPTNPEPDSAMVDVVSVAAKAVGGKIDPAPAPKPGDVCPNCNGKGKVGDGTVMVPCKPCKGTGKVLPPEQPKPKAEPVKQPRNISTEPTAKLFAEWDQWRRGPAPRTDEIQAIYEQLLSRGVIRRDGEPVSDGGRRRIGRRR